MSFWNDLGDAIPGLLWQSRGLVNPWRLASIAEQQAKDIARASGVGVGGSTVVAPSEVVQKRIADSVAEIEGHLRAQGQHPDQLDVKSSLLKFAGLAIGGAIFVWLLKEVLVALVSRRK